MNGSNRKALIVGGAIGLALIAALIVGIVVLKGPSNSSPRDGSSPTPNSVRADVEKGYLRYWEVLASATESLDPSELDSVLTGEALDLTHNLIEEQRQKNEPLRTQVEHNYRITVLDSSNASVDDTFVDRTVRLDPQTRQPSGTPANQTIRNSYTMKKESGTWMVAAIIQYRSPSP